MGKTNASKSCLKGCSAYPPISATYQNTKWRVTTAEGLTLCSHRWRVVENVSGIITTLFWSHVYIWNPPQIVLDNVITM